MGKIKVTFENDGKMVKQIECDAIVEYANNVNIESKEADGSSFMVGHGNVSNLCVNAASALGTLISSLPSEKLDKNFLSKKAMMYLLFGYLGITQEIIDHEDLTKWGG